VISQSMNIGAADGVSGQQNLDTGSEG